MPRFQSGKFVSMRSVTARKPGKGSNLRNESDSGTGRSNALGPERATYLVVAELRCVFLIRRTRRSPAGFAIVAEGDLPVLFQF